MSGSNHISSFPSDASDPIALADWMELSALKSSDHNTSLGDLRQKLNLLESNNFETICIKVIGELDQRIEAGEDGYPFSFNGTLLQLKKDWKQFTPYVFCLLLSCCVERKKRVNGYKPEMMFEHLSCLAARHYLGEGKVLRFGHPRDTMPKPFKQAIEKIIDDVGEWSYLPATKKTGVKDDRLDLIAWKPFPDRLIGKLILFGHCASGKNWREKIDELQPDNFCSKWLGGDKSPIVKSFFIPHRLEPDDFERVAIDAKLFFDRCRIALYSPSDEFRDLTQDRSVRWCEALLKRIVH